MQIIYMDPFTTLLVDIGAWLVFHLGIGFACSKIPLDWLRPECRFFHAYAWEDGGELYQRLFRVRAWKRYIPNGSALYKGTFSIKNLPTNDIAYLQRWLKESVRTEVCHWLMILPGFLFFLWNDVIIGWVMTAYAFLNNLVPIIVQRFNRPRMRRLLARLEAAHPAQQEVPASPRLVPTP